MRKRISGRRFKRDANERKALFKSLMSSVILYERIQTTEQKAKSIKGSLEKLITRAKKDGKKAESMLAGYLNAQALKKLLSDVAPRFSQRPGGYTRIIRLGKRTTDSASLVYLELVEKAKGVAVQSQQKVEKVDEPKTQAEKTGEESKDSKTKARAKKAVKK